MGDLQKIKCTVVYHDVIKNTSFTTTGTGYSNQAAFEDAIWQLKEAIRDNLVEIDKVDYEEIDE